MTEDELQLLVEKKFPYSFLINLFLHQAFFLINVCKQQVADIMQVTTT